MRDDLCGNAKRAYRADRRMAEREGLLRPMGARPFGRHRCARPLLARLAIEPPVPSGSNPCAACHEASLRLCFMAEREGFEPSVPF